MEISKTLFVTNHANHDLKWIKMTYKYGFSPDNTIIYDRTPDDFPGKHKIERLGKVIKSPNVGSNIYDIGRYIVDHYDNLPDIVVFIKGNLLQKEYTTIERFIYGLNANWFVPLDRGNLLFNLGFSNHGYLYYCNDNWYCHPTQWEIDHQTCDCHGRLEDNKVYPRIKSFKDFLQDLFVLEDHEIPKHLSFAPGANYVVPKNSILKYSKNFYRKFMDYTDYNNNPVEAHWFERILQIAWQGCLEENIEG